MIRVIVVDDEVHIREGISRFISRSIDGFEVIHSFCDGDEAIEFLKENTPDIIITDIRMSRISGIELAKYVHENKPHINMIMLSGYSDFEYAQSAITYGVKAYLLKPTNFDELRNALMRFKEQTQKNGDYIESFIDNAKNMFEMIVQSDVDSGMKLTGEIVAATEKMDYPRAKKYVQSFLEVIYDKTLANLKIDLKGRGINIDEVDAADSREALAATATELMKNTFGLLKKSDNKESAILEKAKKYIDENFSSDLSLQDVADCVYLNPVYFSRFFKIHTGQNFSEYLLDKRMKHAAELLNTNMRISDVSDACGYNNLGYFSRAFKEYYKCTPKEYSRKMNN